MAKRPRRTPPKFAPAGAQGGNPRAAPFLGTGLEPETANSDQPDPAAPDNDPDSPAEGGESPTVDEQGAGSDAGGAASGPTTDSDMTINEDEDGGAVVQFGKPRTGMSRADVDDWYENLVDVIDQGKLDEIAVDLIDKVEHDISTRQPHMERVAEGMKRTGIAEPAPGGASFEGASRVTHPLLTQVAVDYCARVVKELFPRDGVVKASVQGTWTAQKQERSDRKTAYFNDLFLNKAPEVKSAFEGLMMQQPLAGSGYLKVLWDHRRNRPTVEYVSCVDLVLPAFVTSFETTHRFTHIQTITRAETLSRMRDGLYVEIDEDELGSPESSPDTSAVDDANAVIAGSKPDTATGEGVDEIFEVHVDLALDEDPAAKGKTAPYIVTVMRKTKVTLSFRRNWAKADETREREPTVVEFGLLPWESGTFIGIWELSGSLAVASTGALRSLLDSALVNNSLTGIRLKGTRISGQDVNPQIGQISEIEGSGVVDDIRKLAMPVPFNPPSPILFELLQFLVAEGKSLLQTSLESTPQDTNANTPVGTQLSRIEQAMSTFSSVFARQHGGFNRMIRIMHRYCSLYLEDRESLEEDAELLARRMDFQGPPDVMPTSDPDIYSDMQRYAQLQAVREMATTAPPGQYDLKAVDKRMLKLMHVDGVEELMPEPQPPPRRHAVAENGMIAMGMTVIAYPDQDHLAHLTTHLDFANSPTFGMGPLLGPKFLPTVLAHIKQHVVMFYSALAYKTVTHAAGLDDLEGLSASVDDQNALDAALSAASGSIEAHATAVLASAMQKVQQLAQAAAQMAAQNQPGMPPDTSVQTATIKAQSDQQIAQLKIQAEQQKAQMAAQAEQAAEAARSRIAELELQLEHARAAQDAQEAQGKIAADLEREKIEDQTALTISQQRQQDADKQLQLDAHNSEQDRQLEREKLHLEAQQHQQGLQHEAQQHQQEQALAAHDAQASREQEMQQHREGLQHEAAQADAQREQERVSESAARKHEAAQAKFSATASEKLAKTSAKAKADAAPKPKPGAKK